MSRLLGTIFSRIRTCLPKLFWEPARRMEERRGMRPSWEHVCTMWPTRLTTAALDRFGHCRSQS